MVKEFKSGKLSTFMKSEPIPMMNNGTVKVVVGATYKDMVLNNDDDVFVDFYNPGCGFCKKLAPVFEKLANQFEDVPHLTFAKLDYTANDAEGAEVSELPTLILFTKDPRTGKKVSYTYSGNKDLVDLKKFIREKSHASMKYDLSKAEL